MYETAEQRGNRQIQELYHHLEHITNGDKFIAFYGQMRAKELNHIDAIKSTLTQFNIRNQKWYQLRIQDGLTEL